MAKEKSKSIRLKLPAYHGKMIKSVGWPNLLIFDKEGALIYNGPAGDKFESALKDALKK